MGVVIAITRADTRMVVCPPLRMVREGILEDLKPHAVEPFAEPASANETRGTPDDELALIRATAKGVRLLQQGRERRDLDREVGPRDGPDGVGFEHGHRWKRGIDAG